MSDRNPTKLQTELLLAALPHVPFDGWSWAALERGAEDAAIEKPLVRHAFPEGARDAVAAFSAWADHGLERRLAHRDLAAMRVRDRVTLAVRTRLEILTPHKEAERKALALIATPPGPFAARLLYNTCDRIWRLAGDTSTDYNFYTKRALLAGVVTSTTLVWLGDTTDGHEATWAFLDRRIENVMQMGKRIGQAKARADKLDPKPLFDLLRRFAPRRAA
jgi:ubiquinone biosynthesis protein COQ9